jgi:hypothetical protein
VPRTQRLESEPSLQTSQCVTRVLVSMIQDNVLVSFTKEALIYQAKFKTQPRILQNHIGLNYSLIKRFL